MSPLYRNRTDARERHRKPGDEQGSALVWALFFVAITAGMMISHSTEMQSNRKDMDVRYRQKALAANIANSGLTDTAAWFRRQATQPVPDFAPQSDPAANPPVIDTIDPSKGLVREFEVRGSLWGRYEIRKDEAEDVSAAYGQPAGSIWDVGSRGILYEVVDKTKPFNQYPNRVVATQTMRTEIRGVPMAVPAQSAVLTQNPTKVTIGSGASITGSASSPGLTFVENGVTGLLSTLTGTPSSLRVPGMDLSMENVFGMREDRLENVADLSVKDARDLLRRPLQDQFVFVDGSLKLDTAQALRGRAAIVIKGDFEAKEGNGTDLTGLIYVRGKTSIKGPFRLRGTLIGAGDVEIAGTAKGPASIEHDAFQVSRIDDALGRYRKSKDVRPAGKDRNGAYTDLGTRPARTEEEEEEEEGDG